MAKLTIEIASELMTAFRTSLKSLLLFLQDFINTTSYLYPLIAREADFGGCSRAGKAAVEAHRRQQEGELEAEKQFPVIKAQKEQNLAETIRQHDYEETKRYHIKNGK